ncbi:hypothetical protein MNBD_PLANCTO02-3335 [hydrothermal vent metagenome]|uniref:histidine kinase n=1 Tax=hydrothermal vent metagenome TaxID=652676 RepID=A0A3B1DQY7_9ZZZZ
MKRGFPVLGIYVGILVIIASTMIWITLRTLKVEREERLTVHAAENERLALWRMESMMLPLILSESSRDFSLFMPQPTLPETSLNIASVSNYVTYYFQSTSTGNLDFLRSVDYVQGKKKKRLQNQTESKRDVQLKEQLLASNNHKGLFKTLHGLPVKPFPLLQPASSSIAMAPNQPPNNSGENVLDFNAQAENAPGEIIQQNANPFQQQAFRQAVQQSRQRAASNKENDNRIKANSTISQIPFIQQSFQNQFETLTSKNEILVSPMTIFWHEDQLFLARLIQNVERAAEDKTAPLPIKGKVSRVRFEKIDLAQGCLLDWRKLKINLISQIKDLLPNANLVPVTVGKKNNPHSLATIPVMLVPGKIILPAQAGWSPMQVSLLVAWGWLLLSAVAMGALLFGVVRLSERRATFVSAVTHELRTPLTTFQLYSDLLANRALTDEKHSQYVKVLQVESERLAHLIENVLSWSRLERSPNAELIETIQWKEFVARIKPSLTDRVHQAGMMLDVKSSDLSLIGNRTAVERILFNLVDNSCKYAKHANNKKIQIELELDGNHIAINIRDYGSGISAELRSSIFEPFTKSATDAARSAAGVGLGLSLCRRLARQMKGDLILTDSTPAGTTFQLRLPASTST